MVIRVFVASSSGSVAVSGGERRGEGRGAGRGAAAGRAQPAGPGTARGEAARRLSAAARRPRRCRACPRLRDLAPHAGMDRRVSGLLRNAGLNLTGLPMQLGEGGNGNYISRPCRRVPSSSPRPPDRLRKLNLFLNCLWQTKPHRRETSVGEKYWVCLKGLKGD